VTAPDVSVLLPLQEHRDVGEECVRQWSTGQTLARERYELVCLAPGSDPVLEAGVRPLLAAGDRWIAHDSVNMYELFNAGASAARGRFVFLTEAHCVPEPDCLAEMIEFLDSTGRPGARGRSIGVARGALGRLEQIVFEEDLRVEEEEGHWRKVLVHCLAIDRQVFLKAGGFAHRYGAFSPWALSIALYEAGHRLAYAPGPAVSHMYTGELGGHAEHVRDFARGEMAYHADTRPEQRAPYLTEAEEWTGRWAYTRPLAREAIRAALAARHRAPGVLAAGAGHAVVAVADTRGAVALARGVVAGRLARVRLDPGTGDRRLRAYRLHWEACARLGRREYLIAHPPGPPPEPPVALHVDLLASANPMAGFHAVERWKGRRFRWTSPLSLVQVALPSNGRYEAALELAFPREADVRVVIDGQPAACKLDDHALRFFVDGGGRKSVALTCSALRPRRHGQPDARDLGLPVRSLRFTPA
jgi:hypothetical protein